MTVRYSSFDQMVQERSAASLVAQPREGTEEKVSRVGRSLTEPPLEQFQPRDIYEEGIDTYFILAFDGGGTRGVISLKLAELMQKAGAFTFRDADCYAGSSTGAIISLGMTQIPIPDILKAYKSGMSDVFSVPWKYWFQSIFGLRGSIYPTSGLSHLLDQFVGQKRMEETDKDLVITSFDDNEKEGVVFENFPGRHQESILMKTAALASTAAKIYFLPVEVEGRLLIDGGFYQNNPSHIAYSKVRENRSLEGKKVFILSFGTGRNPVRKQTFEQTKNASIISNILDVVDDLLFSQSDSVMEDLAEEARENPNVHFLRLQPDLDESIPLDDTNPETVKKMELIAETYFKSLIAEGLKEKVLDPIHNLFASQMGGQMTLNGAV